MPTEPLRGPAHTARCARRFLTMSRRPNRLALCGWLLLVAVSGLAAQQEPGAATAPPVAVDIWPLLFVFVLSSFIGLGVIRRVSRLLHTPLMSITNAISAIAVVGSIIVTGGDYPEPIRIMGAVALFASMTNIVSGFLITNRMLKMFKTDDKTAPGGRS
jgi:proton-translocating NAD(P)+ transhydrogenase subunit alpha